MYEHISLVIKTTAGDHLITVCKRELYLLDYAPFFVFNLENYSHFFTCVLKAVMKDAGSDEQAGELHCNTSLLREKVATYKFTSFPEGCKSVMNSLVPLGWFLFLHTVKPVHGFLW